MKPCAVEGCSKNGRRRGLCSSHWRITFPADYDRHKADSLARAKTAAGRTYVREYTKNRRDLPHVRAARTAAVARYHDKPESRWVTHNRTAKKRGLASELTREQFDLLTTQPCAYCGEMSPGKPFVGIDRLDSKLGYTDENCVPCCMVCNQMKMGRTMGDFIAKARQIVARSTAVVARPFEKRLEAMEGRRGLLAAVGVLIVLALVGCGLDTGSTISSLDLAAPWSRHEIYKGTPSGADGVNLLDVDGDGLLDVTTPWEQSAKVTVSLHPATGNDPRAVWPTVIIPTTISSPEDAFFADVDHDGHVDVVSASDAGKKVYVSWGPTNPAQILTPSAWTTITITASINVQNWLTIKFADMDGDGVKDIVAGGRIGAGAAVGYFTTSAARTASSYTWHSVAAVGSVYSIEPLDVDGDGDIDLVISDGAQIGADTTRMGSRWIENPQIGGGSWTNHTIHVYKGAEQLARYLYADAGRVIDGSSRDTGDSFLAIRTTSNWSTWSASYVIPPQLSNAGHYKAVAPGDLDGDGLEDLVITMHHADTDPATSPQDLSGVLWLRNDGAGGWERGEISGVDGFHFDNLTLYDVDGDGDLDVVTSEQGLAGTTPAADKLGLIWFENSR